MAGDAFAKAVVFDDAVGLQQIDRWLDEIIAVRQRVTLRPVHCDDHGKRAANRAMTVEIIAGGRRPILIPLCPDAAFASHVRVAGVHRRGDMRRGNADLIVIGHDLHPLEPATKPIS